MEDASKKIELNTFVPRDYQIPIIQALEEQGYDKLVVVLPRRAGKDICCFNIMVRQALKRIGSYYYILPNAVQARRVMFEGMTIDGKKILDFIPKELIKNINIAQMKIVLHNDSIIQFVGSDNYDSLRGTNAVGIVLSEAAYQHPQVYPTLRPVLIANKGWVIFISTPFGHNHFHQIYEIAQKNPKEWWLTHLTIEDTKHISPEQVQQEIESGEISVDMAQQEYFCDFSTGAIGSYYASYLIRMELNHQVGHVDYEPFIPVHTAWDLGMRDNTVILMFQIIDRQIRIIDMYENNGVGIEHYISVLRNKEYIWGQHLGPHDLQQRDFSGGGYTRLQKAEQLGFPFILTPNISILDGIETVRTMLPRMYIDSRKCQSLLKALRNYRKEFNSHTQSYSFKPLHDKHSHAADALRYLCVGLSLIKNDDISSQEVDDNYRKARYGTQHTTSPYFNNPY